MIVLGKIYVLCIVLKSRLKSTNVAFCSYLRYELFHSLDHFIWALFCRLKFKDVKLIDVCNRDITAMLHNLKHLFYSFDICNPNPDFISINETNKRGCLFLKTCNNKKYVF